MMDEHPRSPQTSNHTPDAAAMGTNAPATTQWRRVNEADGEREIPLNLISLQALIDTLVAKGIVTAEELSQAEIRHRQQVHEQSWRERPRRAEGRSTSYHYRSIYDSSHGSNSHRHRWLKRKMSKHRWSRRLGTWLFGWKWKKISKESKSNETVE